MKALTFTRTRGRHLTVKPVDGGLGRGGVVEGHSGLPLQLSRLPVRVQVDHRQAGLLVDLRGPAEIFFFSWRFT